MLNRRLMLTGLSGVLCAPALARASSLMPGHSWSPVADALEREWARGSVIVDRTFRLERCAVLRDCGLHPAILNCIIISTGASSDAIFRPSVPQLPSNATAVHSFGPREFLIEHMLS